MHNGLNLLFYQPTKRKLAEKDLQASKILYDVISSLS